MASSPPESGREGWTPYSPSPPPANAGVCSFCGHRQTPDCRVVMSHDGAAGICERCVDSHARFFARRRGERS